MDDTSTCEVCGQPYDVPAQLWDELEAAGGIPAGEHQMVRERQQLMQDPEWLEQQLRPQQAAWRQEDEQQVQELLRDPERLLQVAQQLVELGQQFQAAHEQRQQDGPGQPQQPQQPQVAVQLLPLLFALEEVHQGRAFGWAQRLVFGWAQRRQAGRLIEQLLNLAVGGRPERRQHDTWQQLRHGLQTVARWAGAALQVACWLRLALNLFHLAKLLVVLALALTDLCSALQSLQLLTDAICQQRS